LAWTAGNAWCAVLVVGGSSGPLDAVKRSTALLKDCWGPLRGNFRLA